MPFHETTLKNGLRVIAELNEHNHSTAAGFFVRAGSRDESTDLSGVSHFLEHMAFKGGKTRDALTVNRDFDRVGAKHNAQTSEEDTIFHVACLPEYLPQSFDVLAEIVRPRLDEDDFAMEKQVIIEEIMMYLDSPMMTAYEVAKQAHFGAHALGQSILGTVQSITDLRVEQMREYYRHYYSPQNIVLAFSGKSDWDKLVDLAETRCGDWSGGSVSRNAQPVQGLHAFQVLPRPEDHQQTLIGVCDAPGLESPDRYAASLLAMTIGDSSGSRLYWELIDQGLADSADFSHQEYQGAGAFFLFLSCDPENAQNNLERVNTLFTKIMAEGIDESELEQAKNKVLARQMIRSERPMGRLMPLGYYWTYYHKYITIEEEVEAYQRVTRADMLRVLDRWALSPLTLVSAGPLTTIHPPA